ncbi:MAG: c-type cytochrome [Nitrospira sp.]|nr:cytochrome c [Nitrospira sp.]
MGGALIKPAILIAVIYLFLKLVVPNLPGSAPLPASLITLYIALTIAGIMIFKTLTGGSMEEFLGPVFRFISGERQAGAMQTARFVVLALFPLFIGYETYASTAPSALPPAENRTIHPAPPGEFTGLSNPVPNTPENIMQGKGLYAAYCSPCHGQFDGKGPAARGFNPPPANFKDPTTIAMLQESYLFWRIKKGGVGLSVEGMPWKSAMPRWEVELKDEQIWKIIMGEYDGAGQKPRTWE